jgi:6-pyruvoyltetrahydropterin/6-carboxytetrahydropterin synthase
MELRKTFQIEAAHRLPNVPTGHKCARLHGHSFRCQLRVAGTLEPTLGWVVDFADMEKAVEHLRDQLEHRYLNDVAGLDNPTSELLAAWMWREVAPLLPGLAGIVVAESSRTRCIYRGPATSEPSEQVNS